MLDYSSFLPYVFGFFIDYSLEYKVHASNILEQLFSNLSQRKIKFRKPKHPYQLTKWLVDNKPDFLSGLAEEIAKMLNYEERSHRQP